MRDVALFVFILIYDSGVVMKITIEQLTAMSLELSTEGVTEFTPGEGFTDKLKGMYAATTQFVKESLDSIFKGKADPVDLNKLLQIAEQFSTTEMDKVQVMQPTRLVKPWLEFAQALESLQAITLNIDKDLIYPFSQYVGKAINNPSLLTSHSFNPEGYKFTDTSEYRKKLNSFITGPEKEFVPWVNAFPRQKDVVEFERVLQRIVLNDSKLSPITVEKAVTALNGTVRILMDDIDDPSSQHILNKRSASYLSELLIQLAKHVELYVITHNLVNDLLTCALKTQETLGVKS